VLEAEEGAITVWIIPCSRDYVVVDRSAKVLRKHLTHFSDLYCLLPHILDVLHLPLLQVFLLLLDFH
jgi:hypothetical protein